MTPSESATYRILAHRRRRQLLRYLQDAEDKVAQVDTLVECIAQEASDSPPPDRRSIRIGLYHHQLPFLDEKGVIDFDHRSETVRYRSHPKLEAELEQGSDAETADDAPPFP
ncbi:DUF7344 domain-containing protein [Halosimplex halophilum]|uniref:DUF7344 domain-containing protein n=1 Tax=Halosimplex halophilum TaxID=2559572 RepID=UPI001435570D|nr:hypothetical protein [Halosimplex halophilum]